MKAKSSPFIMVRLILPCQISLDSGNLKKFVPKWTSNRVKSENIALFMEIKN
jgi:hypothetical protein